MEPQTGGPSAPDADPMREYRAVAPLAPVAVVLGLAASLALFHPVLWVVPVLAIVVALLALRTIAREPDAWTGRRAAILGLALGVFFAACAPTRMVLQRTLIARQSRQFAEAWLRLMKANRVQTAHQWTLNPAYRVPEDVDLREYYENDTTAKQELDEFLDEEGVQRIVQLGQQGQWRFVRTVATMGNLNESLSIVEFAGVDPGISEPFRVRLAIKRTRRPGEASVQWQVTDVVIPDSSAHSHT